MTRPPERPADPGGHPTRKESNPMTEHTTTTRSAPTSARVTVRPVTSESELHEHVRRWAEMSGKDPEYVDALIEFQRQGLLGTGPDTVAGAYAEWGLPAAAASATIVLCAAVDGLPVGGVIVAPSIGKAVQAVVDSDDPDAAVPMLQHTTWMQVLAVDPEHRFRGIGTALVQAAVAAAAAMGARVLVGDFPDDPELISFFRGAGLTVPIPGPRVDSARHEGDDYAPEDASRVFTHSLT
ncbi:GNAT family N-acetyltransferase [Nocardia takedensis]